MTGLAGQQLGERDAFVLGLVSQHRAADDIADGKDAVDIALEMLADDDPAFVVALDAQRFETEPVGVGDAADRHQYDVGGKRLGRSPLGLLDGDRQALARGADAGDLGGEPEREALPLQQPLQLLRRHRHRCRAAIRSRNSITVTLAPSLRPDRAELKADDAGADHQQLARDLVEGEGAGRGNDALLVDLDALEAGAVGTGGDDDAAGGNAARFAIVAPNFDLARPNDAGGAVKGGDLVLAEQEIDALGVAVDGFLLERHQARQIERRRAGVDSHLGEAVPSLGKQLGGVEQGLGGNAADIEAGAAMGGALLDHCHLHAELGGADGADIAAGSGADHREVEHLGHGVRDPAACAAGLRGIP